MAVESPFICGPGVGLPVLGGLVIACVRRGLLQILGPVHVVKCHREAHCAQNKYAAWPSGAHAMLLRSVNSTNNAN